MLKHLPRNPTSKPECCFVTVWLAKIPSKEHVKVPEVSGVCLGKAEIRSIAPRVHNLPDERPPNLFCIAASV